MCIPVDDDKRLRSSTSPRIEAPAPRADRGWRAALARCRALAGGLRDRFGFERRMREAALLTERLEDVARASGDWIWETDSRHRYTWVHDAGLLAAVQSIEPPRIGDPIPAGTVVGWLGEPEPPLRTLHDVLALGEPIVRLVTKERGCSGVRFVSRSAVPLLDAHGRLRGYRGSARDVTQSLDAKAQLWRRDEVLRQAKEQAEARSAAKSVLVSTLGHELRTPLNAIVGLAQLIQARSGHGDKGPVDDWIEQIARTGWHMVDVLDLLMELGRAGAAGAALGSEPVDVVAVTRDALRLVERDAQRRSIDVSLDIQTPVWALGDRRAVCQIVTNLLSNAVKYNRNGGSIWVRLSAGQQVRIMIQDTGTGLTEQQIARLYRPFDRLGVKHVPGHGLGLAICNELACAMGGDIEVRSIVGVGSTFTLVLASARAPTSGEAGEPRGHQSARRRAAHASSTTSAALRNASTAAGNPQ